MVTGLLPLFVSLAIPNLNPFTAVNLTTFHVESSFIGLAILLRILLALYLGVDLAILTVIVTQLALMKRSSVHLKRTVSKLSYIFCGVTTLSTLLILAELIVNAPSTVSKDVFCTYLVVGVSSDLSPSSRTKTKAQVSA